MTASKKITLGLRTFATDIAQGFFEITHNGFALVGLAVIFAVIALTARPELRQVGEIRLFSWLQTRQIAVTGSATELDAVDRATASNPQDLPKQQAAIAYWLSKKYRIAPEPLSALVTEAYEIGTHTKLDPTLILAVMAVESGFNPFAQSAVGAQGLMQVMTQVHSSSSALRMRSERRRLRVSSTTCMFCHTVSRRKSERSCDRYPIPRRARLYMGRCVTS